jgi:hypothetical protein
MAGRHLTNKGDVRLTTAAVADSLVHARRLAVAAFAAWIVLAAIGAAFGVLAHLPRPAAALVIVAPVLLAVALYRENAALRALLAGFDLRLAIVPHVGRAIFGVAFLVFESRGTLPAGFARPAGWGDIMVGVLAVPTALAWGSSWRHRRRLVLAWNVFGLADILMAALAAQRLILLRHDPHMSAALGRLPFSTLPMFVVPLVIMGHLLVHSRVRGAENRP